MSAVFAKAPLWMWIVYLLSLLCIWVPPTMLVIARGLSLRAYAGFAPLVLASLAAAVLYAITPVGDSVLAVAFMLSSAALLAAVKFNREWRAHGGRTRREQWAMDLRERIESNPKM